MSPEAPAGPQGSPRRAVEDTGVGAPPPALSAAPAPSLDALERERRALLGDARSVDRLDEPGLTRFVDLSRSIRESLRLSGKVPAVRSIRARRGQADISDF